MSAREVAAANEERKRVRAAKNRNLREKRAAQRKRLFHNPETAKLSKAQRVAAAKKTAARRGSKFAHDGSDEASFEETEAKRRKALSQAERDVRTILAATQSVQICPNLHGHGRDQK
jgi:hypothetical protein